MQQMILEFEDALIRYGNNRINGINAAMELIVEKYSINEADSICSYISKRLGIAEWIVRVDMRQRYMQVKKE